MHPVPTLPFAIVLLVTWQTRVSALSEDTHNVCSRDVMEEEEFSTPYHKPEQIVTTTFCLANWPPICEQKKTIYKLSYRKETRTRLRKSFYCCPGYAEHGDRYVWWR